MSTYLDLCKDTRRECGIAGTGPTSVLNQTGELDRIVNWVRQAWTEIQNRHTNWEWMRTPFTLTTVADQAVYAPTDSAIQDDLAAAAITRFSHWRIDNPDIPPFIYLQSAGEDTQTIMVSIPWPSYRWLYQRGSQVSAYPIHLSNDEQDNLLVGQIPNDVYIIKSYYQRSAQILTADGDIPEMPTDFHDLIVYRALEKYGFYESANEAISRAQLQGATVMRQLESRELPEITVADPMA